MDAIALIVLSLFAKADTLHVLECGQVGEKSITISGLETKMRYDTTGVECHAGGETTLQAMGPCACITEWDEPTNNWIHCAIECRVGGRKLALDCALYAKNQPIKLIRERKTTTTRSNVKGQEPSVVEKAKQVQESWDEQTVCFTRCTSTGPWSFFFLPHCG